MGKNDLMGPFLVHKFLGSRPCLPSPNPLSSGVSLRTAFGGHCRRAATIAIGVRRHVGRCLRMFAITLFLCRQCGRKVGHSGGCVGRFWRTVLRKSKGPPPATEACLTLRPHQPRPACTCHTAHESGAEEEYAKTFHVDWVLILCIDARCP